MHLVRTIIIIVVVGGGGGGCCGVVVVVVDDVVVVVFVIIIIIIIIIIILRHYFAPRLIGRICISTQISHSGFNPFHSPVYCLKHAIITRIAFCEEHVLFYISDTTNLNTSQYRKRVVKLSLH